MRIKQLEELKNKIRPYLRDYLEEHDTVFSGNHLTCPCRSNHRNDDNTPSASFFPDDEHIKCFVCSDVVNADIFACAYFLEGKPLTGSEFISDNVLYLAKKFGITYEIEDISTEEKQAVQLRELLELANKMMRAVIKQNHPSLKRVQDYIRKRRWEKIVDKFEFGYCLYDKLIANLEKRGYTNKQLEMVGLVDKEVNKINSAEAVLNNRLVFPIRDGYGRIVGFASRRLEEKNGATKYLNFRATNLYRKADILYNLKEAKNYPKVYIVEGYSDVWALSLRGIDNVIALCGLGFSDKQYDLLVYNRIKQLCLSLDNDEAGKEAIIRIVEEKLKNKADIEVTIKELDEAKDPDDYLQSHNTKEFLNLPELTIFDWKLQDLKKNKENEFLKNDLIQLIVNEEDYINTEQMIRDLSDVLEVTFDTLKKEVERNRKLGRGKYLLTSRDILKEKASLENEVNNFESWAWSRGNSLLGLKTGYPILTKKLDGLQNAFYLLAGDTNIGKSALLLNLTLNLIKNDSEVFVLFFSIDDNVKQILPRLLATTTDLAINTIANPKFKIKYNKELQPEKVEELLKVREKAVNDLKGLANSLAIKEENDIRSIEEMEKYIRIYKEIAGKKQLVVIVDNLHRIKTELRFASTRETYMYISDTLKRWKTDYDIPVVATAEIKKINSLRRPTGDDIKEVKDLQFDSDLTALLYNDFYLKDDSTLYFVDESGESQPIIEMAIIKNKTGGFKGKLYYKFHKDISKIVECSKEEMETYFQDFQK